MNSQFINRSKLFIIDGNWIKTMSAVSGQKYTYIKSRTIGFKHFGQKPIIIALWLTSYTSVPLGMSVCVCMNVSKCKMFTEHALLKNLTGQGMIFQLTLSDDCLRWFFWPGNLPSPHPVTQDTGQVSLLHQALPSFPTPETITVFFLLWIRYVYRLFVII